AEGGIRAERAARPEREESLTYEDGVDVRRTNGGIRFELRKGELAGGDGGIAETNERIQIQFARHWGFARLADQMNGRYVRCDVVDQQGPVVRSYRERQMSIAPVVGTVTSETDAAAIAVHEAADLVGGVYELAATDVGRNRFDLVVTAERASEVEREDCGRGRDLLLHVGDAAVHHRSVAQVQVVH